MFQRQPPPHRILPQGAQGLILEATNQIAALLHQDESAESLYQYLIHVAATLFEVDARFIFIRIADPATGKTKFLCTVDNPYEDRILREDLSGVVGRALRTRTVQMVPDVTKDPDFIATFAGSRAELVIPLMLGTRCYGVLNVEAPRAHWFGPDDVLWGALLASQAAQIADADERESTRTVGMNSEIEAIFAEVTRRLPVPATVALMRRVPKTQDRLLIVAISPPERLGQYLRLRAGQGITAQVIITREPFAGAVNDAITHLITTRSALVIPIPNPDPQPNGPNRPLGVLNIESPDEHGLTVEMLEQIMQPALLERLSAVLLTPPTIEQRLDALVDVDSTKTTGVYTQILTLVNDYLARPQLSGAITLLRDREENLAQLVAPEQWASDPRWIVVQGTFGDYQTAEPDRRLNRPSLTRRVLTNGKPLISADVTTDPDYWSLGEGLHSMVAVPIFDREIPIGTLEVLHPDIGVFGEEDVAKLAQVATYVGQLIKRITDQETAQLAERKLEYTARLRELTAPLYEWESLGATGIEPLRDAVLTQILQWALEETGSQYGTIFQAETIEDQADPDLVLRVAIGPRRAGAPTRIRPRADDAPPDSPVTYLGLIGKALLTDTTQRIQSVAESPDYQPSYPGVQREIATPMRRGHDQVGVLNVETSSDRYYTVADRSWVEFFADRVASALNTVEIAQRAQRQVRLKALLRSISQGVARLRAMDRHTIRDSWHSLRQQLLEEICNITGVRKATIFTAVNLYDADGNLDLEHGQLVEATAWPRSRQKGQDRVFFSARDNLAGLVLRTQERVIFNRRGSRPDEFSPLPDQSYEVKSGVALPITEGARIVGVLQLDHDQSGFCTEENIAIAEEAAQMAGDVLVASRIRLDEIQVRYLRDYELEMLSLGIPDTHAFMLLTLQTLRRLANVVDGWGQVMLLRNYRMDDGTLSLRIERNYEAEFDEERPQTISEWPDLTGDFAHDHPFVRFDLYHEVIATRQMRVLLDAQRLPAEQLRGIAWPTARSLLCVPLVQPRTSEDDLEVFGLLVVASRRATRFNDNDLSIVSRLARSVVIGYRNLGLANAQKDILAQLTHDLSKAMVPLLHRVEDLTESAHRLDAVALANDIGAVRTQLAQTNQQIDAVRGLVNLSRDLILWSIDLSDKELVVADEPVEPLLVNELVAQMQPRMAVLAQVLSGTEVIWQVPDGQRLAVASSPTRAKLIKATIFKYVENALKYGQGTVRVIITEVAGGVSFAVHSTSPVIPPSERGRIFEMGFRGSNVNPNLPGSGTGLYQVQRTAEILGGRVAYRAEGDDDNVFIFDLPTIAGPTVRKEARA